MKKLKLSQWHDGSITPLITGWYERNWFKYDNFFDLSPYYAYWNGVHWSFSSCSYDLCMKNKFDNNVCPIQRTLEWRGVLK